MLEKLGQSLIDSVEEHCWCCGCSDCDKYWAILEEDTYDDVMSEEFDEEMEHEYGQFLT